MTITLDKALQLPFGYNRGLPEGIKAAWGARWVIKQDGHVDQVPDRQGCDGDETERKRLLDYLNTVLKYKPRRKSDLGDHAMDVASRLLKARSFSLSDETEIVLFEDQHIAVKGNPQASYGYLYVCAYFKPLVSEFERKGEPPYGWAGYTLGLTGPVTILSAPTEDAPKAPFKIEVDEVHGKWSGSFVPQVGERIKITMNGFGPGTVVAFFTTGEWIGVEVRTDKYPAWYVEQRDARVESRLTFNQMVFGAEIAPLTEG